MKIFIVDYIGCHSGMTYYFDSFKHILNEISYADVEPVSNFSVNNETKPILINHYKGNIINKMISLLSNLNRFHKFVKKHPDDLFIYDSFGTILDVFFINIVTMAKHHVIDVHETIEQSKESNKRLKYWIRSLYQKKVNNVIIHSQRSKEILSEFKYRGKIFEVPHFKYFLNKNYDVSKISPEIINSIDNERINILMFGVITREKGADLLIESINHLEDQSLSKINVIYAGKDFDGSCKEIPPRNPKSVKFILRYINDDELKFLFSHVQYIALPYRVTSQSGVLEMAFWFKKPIIASNIPYFKKILSEFPSFGILTEGKNYTEALRKSIEDKKNGFFIQEEYSKYIEREEIENFKNKFKAWLDSF